MNTIVEVKGLCKTRPQFTLNKIDLSIKKGFITGLIGPNGAGKTTLIRCIMDLIRFDEGEIKLFGKTHEEATEEIKQNIGFVYDENYFYEDLSIHQNKNVVKMFYKNWNDDIFHHYLATFQLPTNKKIKDLSKGMKMKFSLAIALSHQPTLLIMDEPTSGLDPIFRRELLDILLDIVQDEEKAIFFSTHMTKDLEQIADYIAFLKDGEIVFSEEKDEILHKYVLIKGSKQVLDQMDRQTIIGLKESSLGFEGIALRSSMTNAEGIIIEKPSLEDIMFYTVRGKSHASSC